MHPECDEIRIEKYAYKMEQNPVKSVKLLNGNGFQLFGTVIERSH